MNKISALASRLSPYSPAVLRLSVGLVFVYFGWTSVASPDMWAGYVPEWMASLAAAETLVRLHGAVEIALGVALSLGIAPRLIGAALFLDLLHIVSLVGWGPVAARDLGLAGAALAIALAAPAPSQPLS